MPSSTALRRSLAALSLTAAVCGFTTASAHAATTADAGCTAPALSQPFMAFKDANLYTLAPGGAFDEAAGGGWEFSGGASIVQTTQPDGTVGGVLDVPSKARAVSPVLCITSDYPTARLWVRNVAGSEGVFFYVSSLINGTWTNIKNTGQFHGAQKSWTLSNPMNVQPAKTPGWQQVR